ncbi:MAG: RagB/SusD family nutrient uptake outer membrane protein [Bacteroidales bacterium]|nr:RagB/SusD family nutrient uptake outer membrane protein [Bacteroidales bacterium]
MKINKLYIAAALAALALTGCDDFLDTESYTKKTTVTFPKTDGDIEMLLTGCYSIMNLNCNSKTEEVPFMVFDIASDDRLGGGSTSNRGAQSADRLLKRDNKWMEVTWEYRYKGIYNANTILELADQVESWASPERKNQLLGEAHFLRAYYYFNLVQLFGQCPLTLKMEAVNLPKASADEIYAQIATDLKEAIEMMPATKYSHDIGCTHASLWAAEALMARVFLFYTGYYNKTSLPTADGSSISKQQVIYWLEDCIYNSGHGLLADQRSLWPYTYANTKKAYKYMEGVSAEWATDNNQEVIFALAFGNYSSGDLYSNRIIEWYDLRKTGNSGKESYPFVATGYSNGPVNRGLWDDWAADPDYAGDYRREGSICDRAVELPDYEGDPSKEVENSNLFAKKYAGTGAIAPDGSIYRSYAVYFGADNHDHRGHTQNLILIRYADALLMHSELTQTPNGMNQVRARANLPEIGYSLENIIKERRYELCFEGLRWNDLRRWHMVEDIMKSQVGQEIGNRKFTDTYVDFTGENSFMHRYQVTGGFFNIPEAQIILSNGVLTQNSGWENNEGTWTKLPYNTL